MAASIIAFGKCEHAMESFRNACPLHAPRSTMHFFCIQNIWEFVSSKCSGFPKPQHAKSIRKLLHNCQKRFVETSRTNLQSDIIIGWFHILFFPAGSLDSKARTIRLIHNWIDHAIQFINEATTMEKRESKRSLIQWSTYDLI